MAIVLLNEGPQEGRVSKFVRADSKQVIYNTHGTLYA